MPESRPPNAGSRSGPDELRKVRPWRISWEISDPPTTVAVEIALDEIRVQRFRHLNDDGYFSYATKVAAGSKPEIEAIVGQLRKQYVSLYGREPALDRHYANYLKRLVSEIPYEYDDRSIGYEEYAKFPLEVLYDRDGDCECKSILLASMYWSAGFDVALLHVTVNSGKKLEGHAAVGLVLPETEEDDVVEQHGTRYLYCEAVSSDDVGRCAFDFQELLQHGPSAEPVPRPYVWDGDPPGWSCPAGCGAVSPWEARCPACGALVPLSERQARREKICDWDAVLRRFLGWIRWVRSAPPRDIVKEIRSLRESALWALVPTGNRTYLQEVLDATESMQGNSGRLVRGARRHLESAWPHIVASIFCRQPRQENRDDRTYRAVRHLGRSVYDMDLETLVDFTARILLDTTCKRIKGFSGGSRYALGKILEKSHDEAYMREKRKSIENILVKVVVPQAFALLAREYSSDDRAEQRRSPSSL